MNFLSFWVRNFGVFLGQEFGFFGNFGVFGSGIWGFFESGILRFLSFCLRNFYFLGGFLGFLGSGFWIWGF